VSDPNKVQIEYAENGNIRVNIEGESYEFEDPGAIEIVGTDINDREYLSKQWVFDAESGELYADAVYAAPGEPEGIAVTYHQQVNEDNEPLVVAYESGYTAPGEWHGVPSQAWMGNTELSMTGGAITNPSNPTELIAAYQSPQTVEYGLWMATEATADWQASAEQAIAEGRFPGITDVSQLMSFDSPEGVQLLMEVTASQGAEAGASFEADLIAAGMDPADAALYASQLGRQYVVGTLNTAIAATLSPEELQQIQADAEAAATQQMGILPGDPRYPTAVAGIAQGLMMAESAPVLDGYGAFYADTIQVGYQSFVAQGGGSLQDFVQSLSLEQGLSPSANPLEFSVIRSVALANDPAVASLSEPEWNAFFEYPWQDYAAVQSGAPAPAGYQPPGAELLSVYESTQQVDTAINTGVIHGWRAQHDRYIESWLGEGGMMEQIDQAGGGVFAEGVLWAYENFPALSMVPGGSLLSSVAGTHPTLESLFGPATNRAEAEAAIRALDAEMQGFFASLDPAEMSFSELLSTESSYETLLTDNASGIGAFGEAYSQSLGYANVGGEIVKTVGVVGATLLTFTGVGTGAGAAFLASVFVGTGTRIGLDMLDRKLDGEKYDLNDLGDSALRGAFDSSTALISYIGSAQAFRAANAAGQSWGLAADQAKWLGRLAGFGAETAIDGTFTMASSLVGGQSFEEGLFNVALGVGVNLAFSSAFGFDYDTRIVNRAMITEGADAGSFRFTLAEGTERIVPPWAGSLHEATIELASAGHVSGSTFPNWGEWDVRLRQDTFDAVAPIAQEGYENNLWKDVKNPYKREEFVNQWLQEIENTAAKVQGRPPAKVLFAPFPNAPNQMGTYNPAANVITINQNLLLKGKSWDAFMNTVLHEGRHAFQFFAIDEGTFAADFTGEMSTNASNYVTYSEEPGGYQRYREQPMEADAWSFGAELSRALLDHVSHTELDDLRGSLFSE